MNSYIDILAIRGFSQHQLSVRRLHFFQGRDHFFPNQFTQHRIRFGIEDGVAFSQSVSGIGLTSLPAVLLTVFSELGSLPEQPGFQSHSGGHSSKQKYHRQITMFISPNRRPCHLLAA